MGKSYMKCSSCQSTITHEERCDCQQIDLQPHRITSTDLLGSARTMAGVMKKVIDEKTGNFRDPAIAADFEFWKRNREAWLTVPAVTGGMAWP